MPDRSVGTRTLLAFRGGQGGWPHWADTGDRSVRGEDRVLGGGSLNSFFDLSRFLGDVGAVGATRHRRWGGQAQDLDSIISNSTPSIDHADNAVWGGHLQWQVLATANPFLES